METAMFYVYALIDIRTNLPFYIGKGKTKNNRHLDHFNETEENTDNRHKFFKIQYLKDNGYDIPVSILRDNILEEDTAYDIERDYIKIYGRENIDENGILTNICIDNRPPSHQGRKQSDSHINKRILKGMETVRNNGGKKPRSIESRMKTSVAVKGEKNPFYNKHHTEENKKKHSEFMKGNQYGVKTYRFVSPEGTEHIVQGFYKFCKDNELNSGVMEKVMKTKVVTTKGKAKGWFVEKVDSNTSRIK